jgi:hypothetical protein
MIVNRTEFIKFWEKASEFPRIVFCNDHYYLMSLNELYNRYIPNYENFIKNNNLVAGENWDCSKFALAFKLSCDMIYFDDKTDSHLAVGIAHLNLSDNQFDHAINFIIYQKDSKQDYILYDSFNKAELNKNNFKNLSFIYF